MSLVSRTTAASGTSFRTPERPLLIAIVDDDAAVLRALKRLLRTAGMTARTFANGEQFFARLETPPAFAPDCVILDVCLKGASGLEIQERLRGRGRRVPVVFMSGYDEPAARGRAISGGAAAFLRKPFRSSLLFEALATAIGPSLRG